MIGTENKILSGHDRATVFISYCHQDELWKDRLLEQLGVLADEGLLQIWDDRQIRAGDDWYREIETALNRAKATILLVSARFLRSEFIRNVEVPRLLQRRAEEGVLVYPVVVADCPWKKVEWLSRMQVRPRDGRPLSSFRGHSREKALADIATEVLELLEAASIKTSKSPEEKLLAELPNWVERILLMQDPASGGIRTGLLDPQSGTQVWSTAQSLTGILRVPDAGKYSEKIRPVFSYIDNLWHTAANGGWSYFPDEQWAVTEIACWVVAAYVESLRVGYIWTDDPAVQQARQRIIRALDHILARQHQDGGFCPIEVLSPENTRTYTTTVALWSLVTARNTSATTVGNRFDAQIHRAIQWLLTHHHDRYGWVPNPSRRFQNVGCLGLHAQVLFTLALAQREFEFLKYDPAFKRIKQEFLVKENFADRDYFRNDHVSDVDLRFAGSKFMHEGSTFLWCPWSIAACSALATDPALTERDRETAARLQSTLIAKLYQASQELGSMYELAETLFCATQAVGK